MANPNRAFANLPKNPWQVVWQGRSRAEANSRAEAVKGEGKPLKITSVSMGKKPKHWREFRVWTR